MPQWPTHSPNSFGRAPRPSRDHVRPTEDTPKASYSYGALDTTHTTFPGRE
jgi:hypothetical protein